MIGQEGYVEIQVMHRQGVSIKAISRELGISRNTVRRYLRSARVPVAKRRSAKPTKLDGYRDYLFARVAAARPDWIPATVLHAEIVALGYSGCVRTVRNYLATLKPKRKEDPLVRFETEPGQQMQVDWGAFKLDGQRISLFLSTLGWSRFSFGVFVENEQFDTLQNCHEQAFDAFGGVPQEVLYDNMRTVVQQRNAYGRGLHRFHPRLADFAHHYTFLPRLCRPYRAKTKGKVERAIGYIRRSFFVPLVSRYRQLGEALDIDTLNLEFARWLAITANARVHATTGEVPQVRLALETAALQTLPPTFCDGQPRCCQIDRPLMTDFPLEILQHPLSVYADLLEAV
ncbi:MAG: IS21 family transposase [Gammaproteobacteria bacterium]|nr:IS21 family transposase [Gammaproteobacteria bacterium]